MTSTDTAESTATPKYPFPRDLERAGRKLWGDIARGGRYVLRADELRLLEDACREADLIDDLRVALKGQPRIVRGSMGQDAINPLISELRQHRSTLKSLLGSLSLPDDPSPLTPRSVAARRAANARWDKSA